VTDALLWSILLLVLGLGLIALELFVPSGGVLGILAALAIIASIAVAFSGGWVTGVIMLVATMLILPLALAAAIHYWPRTPIGRMILLETPQSEEEVLPDRPEHRKLQDLIGKCGVAKTKMLPSGAVVIEGRVYDAIGEGMAIDPGQPVRVTAVRTNRIVVVLDDNPRELLSETADMLAQPARNLDWNRWILTNLGIDDCTRLRLGVKKESCSLSLVICGRRHSYGGFLDAHLRPTRNRSGHAGGHRDRHRDLDHPDGDLRRVRPLLPAVDSMRADQGRDHDLGLAGYDFPQGQSAVIVRSKIMAVQAGITDEMGVTSRALEAHYLAGGNVPLVVRALIAAQKAKIVDLSFREATASDLADATCWKRSRRASIPK